MTRVVKMFHINQHKLKARGWATQTELVCQDHNRGFVISLYIIFFQFSNILSFTISFILLLLLLLLLVPSQLLRDTFLLLFFSDLLYNHVSINFKEYYIVHQKRKGKNTPICDFSNANKTIIKTFILYCSLLKTCFLCLLKIVFWQIKHLNTWKHNYFYCKFWGSKYSYQLSINLLPHFVLNIILFFCPYATS